MTIFVGNDFICDSKSFSIFTTFKDGNDVDFQNKNKNTAGRFKNNDSSHTAGVIRGRGGGLTLTLSLTPTLIGWVTLPGSHKRL